MTYCVGLVLDEGLVMVSDSRTNAGVDHISTFRKMTVWNDPPHRAMALASAGNLSITQSIIDMVNEGLPRDDKDDEGPPETMMSVATMRDAARLIGRALRRIDAEEGPALRQQGVELNAAFLLGGQIAGRAMRLFHIYAAGNFIEASEQTPFFQIGETKYGKPILDRVVRHDLGLDEGVKLALISMDSTLRSNISVGMPLDVLTIRHDRCEVALKKTITESDPYFRDLQKRWGRALRGAFERIPVMPEE